MTDYEEEFNPAEAFADHVGTYPDLRELLRALGRLRWDNLHLLPVTFNTEELMELGQDRGWIIENEDGSFTIKVGKT